MSAQIHRLTGAGPIIEPDDRVIKHIEEMLAKAKRGEIKAIGYFYVCGNDAISHGYTSGCADPHYMLSGVSLLQHQLITAIVEDKD